MAALDGAEPEARRPCIRAVTLKPLLGGANLRESYTEETADVFFVNREIREKLPAHREVLKVASPVFFRMFSGNWREMQNMEIPAPEEYNWESFKAAITLLYGEEVEVEESSVPDIYRVAHLYSLKGVLAILVHEVSQWDSAMVNTMVKLCVLAQDMPDRSEGLLNTAIQYIARHLQEVNPSDIGRLSFETMLQLVQSECITITELDLVRILNQWTNEHSDITLNQLKQLYSHIRFGTIPYESLAECSVIGHDNLKSALENHQELSVNRVMTNLAQITPRLCQREVFQVYPSVRGLRPGTNVNGQIQVASDEPAFSFIYCGKQEIKFLMELTVDVAIQCHCWCTLLNLNDPASSMHAQCTIQTRITQTTKDRRSKDYSEVTINLKFVRCTVVLNRTGAHLMLQSREHRNDPVPYHMVGGSDKPCTSANMSVPFVGQFPWVFSFRVRDNPVAIFNNSHIFLLTINPPTL